MAVSISTGWPHDAEAQFHAFDGGRWRGSSRLPLSMHKATPAGLLAHRVDGIFFSDFEQSEIGPDPFRRACLMGLEGMVSKHRESAYLSGSGSRPGTSGLQPRQDHSRRNDRERSA
jgi:ATP-dependent DNA ligase